MEEIDEIIKEFLVESHENLDQLVEDLMELEKAPDNLERIPSIFRTIHTIKGTSGFLALPRLERLTHVGESLLVPIRDGELQLTNEIADGLFQMVDAVRNMLGEIESTGAEAEEEHLDLIALLEELQGNPKSTSPDASEDTDETEITSEIECADDPNTQIDDNTAQTESPTVNSNQKENQAPDAKGSAQSHSIADSTLRIDVQILDSLMNLVGELVLSRNQVLQFSSATDDSASNNALQKLNLVTTELQEAVMKTRMQPIRNAWSKLPRVVRDLANTCGKKVQVQMEGADTELDKTVLEAIKDPLTHIVRNSVDHGIDTTEQRLANGKPETGTLWLRAFHEGGQVIIEIADDGRGMDLDRIRAKAVEKGIISKEQAQSMNDRETINLVLLPGFSTAPAVTNVSGRGVGMDVVRTNIERIGGTLDIQSIPGKGTTLRIKLPLTLAIVPALIVKSTGREFAIPQVNLLELLRLDAERAKREIEYVYGTPVYRLRGSLLPLLYLDQLLGIRECSTESDSENPLDEKEAVNIVVLQAEDRQFGLVVDLISDTQEIVVKPLDSHLNEIELYAGATIMGNGSVSLILDAIGLAHKGKILSDQETNGLDEHKLEAESGSQTESWLVLDPGDGTQAAVALNHVARLEEFECDRIERIDNRSVVQYRNHIMPLVNLDGTPAMIDASDDDSSKHVVVCNHQCGQDVGLVIERILDIVEERSSTPVDKKCAQRVISGKVTKVITPEMINLTADGLFPS